MKKDWSQQAQSLGYLRFQIELYILTLSAKNTCECQRPLVSVCLGLVSACKRKRSLLGSKPWRDICRTFGDGTKRRLNRSLSAKATDELMTMSKLKKLPYTLFWSLRIVLTSALWYGRVTLTHLDDSSFKVRCLCCMFHFLFWNILWYGMRWGNFLVSVHLHIVTVGCTLQPKYHCLMKPRAVTEPNDFARATLWCRRVMIGQVFQGRPTPAKPRGGWLCCLANCWFGLFQAILTLH